MSVGNPAFAFTQYPYESRSITPDAQLEVTLFNRDLTRDELLSEFQRFMVGCGYHFDVNEYITVVTDD